MSIYGAAEWHLHTVKAQLVTLAEACRLVGLNVIADSLARAIVGIETAMLELEQ